MTDALRGQWESFWQGLRDDTALWDADPALVAAAHLPLFRPYFGPDLPVVDLGCGNGTQTRFLATKFERVIGVDIAESAITLARNANSAPNITYRVLDLLDHESVTAFHARAGDANVYLRAVLHQLPWTRRWQAVRSLAQLTGTWGHVFIHELTARSVDAVAEVLTRPDPAPPEVDRLVRHFRFGERGGVPDDAELEDLVRSAGFDIVVADDVALPTVATLPGGARLDLPTRYILARAARPRGQHNKEGT
jgi:SAM-dependent methyltransferase